MDESSRSLIVKRKKNKKQGRAQAFFREISTFLSFFCGMASAGKNSGFWRGFIGWRILWFWGVLSVQKAI